MTMHEPTIKPENTPEAPDVAKPQLPEIPQAPVHVEEASDHLAQAAGEQIEPEEQLSPEDYFQQLMNQDIQEEIKQSNYSQPEVEKYMQDIQGVNENISKNIEETLNGIKYGFDQEFNKRNYKVIQRLRVIGKLVPTAGFLTVSALSGGGLTSIPTLLSAGLFLRQLLTIFQRGEWGGDGEFKTKLKKQLEETNQLAQAAQEDLKNDLREWQVKLSTSESGAERKKLYEKAILDMSTKAQEIMLDIQDPQRRIDKLSKDPDALRNPA